MPNFWPQLHLIRMFTVYAIQSEVDKRIYVGFSQDVDKRLKEHNNKKTKSTKGFVPWKLIYQEHILVELKREKEKSI